MHGLIDPDVAIAEDGMAENVRPLRLLLLPNSSKPAMRRSAPPATTRTAVSPDIRTLIESATVVE